MSEYKKGYRFERKVRKYLETLGYVVFRAAGSKPVDLLVFDCNNGYVIECKVSKKYLRKNDINKLMEIYSRTGLIPIFAFREKKKIIFLNLINNERFQFPHINSLSKYIDGV